MLCNALKKAALARAVLLLFLFFVRHGTTGNWFKAAHRHASKRSTYVPRCLHYSANVSRKCRISKAVSSLRITLRAHTSFTAPCSLHKVAATCAAGHVICTRRAFTSAVLLSDSAWSRISATLERRAYAEAVNRRRTVLR